MVSETKNLENVSATKKKIFTCKELEGRRHQTIQVRKGSLENIKHVDSAIVLFSSSTNMTRYDKADLTSIKEGKLSQQPPSCYYDPNIIRLNILKFKNQHTDEMEAQMKVFREKLQNLSVTGWDPNISNFLRNYHNTLLNPFLNGYAQKFPQHPPPDCRDFQQYQSPRRVSFADKQQTVLDKIPSYDRNMNFFDNITTTATMRPPRMGVNAYNNSYKRVNNNNFSNQNYRKPNSCVAENANSYSSSSGYFSANDTKSSCEDSIVDKPCEKKMSAFDKINAEKMEANGIKNSNNNNNRNVEEEEKEPEWFSVPATLDDFVDLRGFEDDVDSKETNDDAKPKVDHQRHQINQQNRRNSFPKTSQMNEYNNNRNMSYRPNQNYQNQHVNNGNQRFRNPLHFNKPQTQRPQNPPLINPFFDAWRNGKFFNQPNVSFTHLMEQQQQYSYPKNLPSTAMHMSEVENLMKQQQNVHGISQIAPPAAVPQFFQNLANTWGVNVGEMQQNNPYQRIAGPQMQTLPTQEQLQKFTSEIMRNAILRKNQQYHDENNYQKRK